MVGPGLILSPREIPSDLGEVLKPWRALGQVTLEPAHRRTLVLRRPSLRVVREPLLDTIATN